MESGIQKLFHLLSRRERLLLLPLFLSMVVGAFFEVVGVGAIPAYLALLSNPQAMLERPIVRRLYEWTDASAPNSFLMWSSIGLLALFAVKNAYLTFHTYLNVRFVYDLQVALSKRLFQVYMHAPYTFHLQRNTAELLRNVKGEVNEVVMLVLMPCLTLCMEALMLVSVFGLLMIVEPVVSAIAFVVLGGASFLFLLAIRKSARQYGVRRHHFRAKLIQYFRQGLGGLMEARLLGREEYFVRAYVESAREYAKAARFHRVAISLPSRVIEMIAVAGMLLIAMILLMRGTIASSQLPILALFAVAAVRLMPSIKRTVEAVMNIRYHMVALNTVYNDLAHLEHIAIHSPHRSPHDSPMLLRNAIDVRNLHYWYTENTRPALEDISLSIPRGSAVAIVGASGAGKTTFLHVLLGLLQPTAGSIEVDGRDVRDCIGGWQCNIGFIPQRPFFADDTIRRNIAFGLDDDDIDEDRIRTVIAAAQIEALVAELPDGLDTVIGEEGVRLSGGQRQRIAIARALYHDPEVLVMDEATSSLDNETERFVMQALERLRGTRTVIIVAHRLSTVRGCDVLFLLSHGRLVAAGSYDELLERSREFQSMATA